MDRPCTCMHTLLHTTRAIASTFIFAHQDPIWLRTMWEDEGTARVDIIEILISLALLKLRSRL